MQSKFLIQNIIGYEVFETQTAAQQINGREGETATLLSRCFVHLACVYSVSPHIRYCVGCQAVFAQFGSNGFPVFKTPKASA
jgi:hypothetical protein